VIASTVPVAPFAIAHGQRQTHYIGAWSGYPAAQARLLNCISAGSPSQTVFLSGDIHSSWAIDVFKEGRSARPVATEIIGTSISSQWPAPLAQPMIDSLSENPAVRFVDVEHRGFALHELSRATWTTTLFAMDTVTSPGGRAREAARVVIRSNRPGIAEVT
jgi:alkaline phosphatase D